MNILFLGDVVGRSGRDAVVKYTPILRKEYALDVVVVSGDNAAGGFGITSAICADFYAAGVDVITGGDHIWDQKDIVPYLSQEKRLLRPLNFPEGTPGRGAHLYTLANGKTILVIHVLGQVFHREHTNCPFATVDKALEGYTLGKNVSAVLVDTHAEATSEKMAMGRYLNGRVSMVVGSHTHVPTQDARILSKGTAYQTDAGMCGDYDSVIGFEEKAPLERFLTKISKNRMEPASGAATLCGVMATIDDKTGLATACRAIQYPKALGNVA
ncbi:MAG: TIGR00282 family metallophosphoesterase [Rickettsiales bacterium]|nr:TIGR00282 family metallophosphoesterase [Rickettsiales bacterium]